MIHEKIERFADRLEGEWRARLKREYPGLDESHSRVNVRPGLKYTRVDIGGSGRYMVVNATGEIFGIKGYGVIHRGHAYGTLDTLDVWDWSGYRATPRKAVTA